MSKWRAHLAAGALLVWRNQRILWWIYAVNLFLALGGISETIVRAGGVLNHSLAAVRLVRQFDLGTLADLISAPSAPFASTYSALWTSIAFFVFMLFTTGGMLASYGSNGTVKMSEFWRAGGWFFGRITRLAVIFFVVVIAVAALAKILLTWAGSAGERAVHPAVGFVYEIVAIGLILLLLGFVRLGFDVAEIVLVMDDERQVRSALRGAAGVARRDLLRLVMLNFTIAAVSLAGLALGLWLWMIIISPTSIGLAIVIGQLLTIWLLGMRLWQRSTEMSWYRSVAAVETRV